LVFGRPFIRLELPFGFCFMIATLMVVDHELSDSGESMSADAWLTDEPTEKPVYPTSSAQASPHYAQLFLRSSSDRVLTFYGRVTGRVLEVTDNTVSQDLAKTGFS
jgi:hypothetical protein